MIYRAIYLYFLYVENIKEIITKIYVTIAWKDIVLHGKNNQDIATPCIRIVANAVDSSREDLIRQSIKLTLCR